MIAAGGQAPAALEASGGAQRGRQSPWALQRQRKEAARGNFRELGRTIPSRHRTGSGPHKLERPAFILSSLAHILLPISVWVATFLERFLHPRHHVRNFSCIVLLKPHSSP